MGVGMPADIWLDEFGYQVWAAFGEIPYHVGSSVMGNQWRDVDVRLILSDEEYERLGLGDPRYPPANAKWTSLVLAYSALGRAMTNLPIDFQIQQQSYANARYGEPGRHVRAALGIHARMRQQSTRLAPPEEARRAAEPPPQQPGGTAAGREEEEEEGHPTP